MSQPFVGEIRMFGGNFAPVGWFFCNGQLVAISEYDTLFNLIGTTYGGDGQNTFALPNLASRVPVHQGNSSFGTYPLGQAAGAENVQLTAPHLPVHNHPAIGSSEVGTSGSPANGFWATTTDQQYSTLAPNGSMSPAALTPSGGSQQHDNMPPVLAINFIISMFGIYPSPA